MKKNTNERKRIREIISVFLKYGIKEGITSMTDPVHVRRALEELGPTFIKIGQILSTRPDILPESYTAEFQKLQDNVRPEAYETVHKIIEEEFGIRISGIFDTFEELPVASASLAQVHLATLRNGERVVVKVQRPRVRETMFEDIKILKRMSLFLKFTPQGQVIDFREVINDLAEVIKNELDFKNEAENIRKFSDLNKTVKYITCPVLHGEYITSKVLVMEYIEGVKISNTEALQAAGYDNKEIATKLAYNYLKQIFEDGFFHGDPHPGNILIREGKIAYIDFGMMGTFTNAMQAKFSKFLYGLATRNIESMVSSVKRIGIRKGPVDNRKLHSDVEEIYNEYIEESLYDIDLPKMMDEMLKVARHNNIAMPREMTMFIKGLMTIEGVVRKIAPEISIMDIALPYVKEKMMRERDYRQDLEEQLENLYSLSKVGLKLPVKMTELVNSALAGKLKVQMEHLNLDKSIGEVNKMVNRLIVAIIVASLVVGSSLVINADIGPKIMNIPAIGFVGYISAAIYGFYIIISILRSGKT